MHIILVFNQLWEILSQQARKRLLSALLLVITMTAIETGGVFSIMPFLAVLATPNLVYEQPQLAALYRWLGFDSPIQFIVVLGISSATVVGLAALFKSFASYTLSRFANLQRYEISTRLLRGYLQQPYIWFLGRNSVELSETMLSEVDQLTSHVLLPVIQMIGSGLVMLAMLMLLLIHDHVIALVATGLLSSLYFTIYRIVRYRLGHIGRERREANTERYQAAAEALAGIKAITLSGKTAIYLDRFRRASHTYSRLQATNETLVQVPRYLVEAGSYASLVALMLILVWRKGDDLGQILPAIGLYGFAAFRMLPAAQSIFRGFSQLGFGAAGLDQIYRDLNLPSRRQVLEAAPWIPHMDISLSAVTYAYPENDARLVLNDINLHIPVNKTIGIIGPTGAGKSTLLDLILGLLQPTGGEVLIDGDPLTAERLPSWHRYIGYVPQEVFLLDDTIAANIALGLRQEEIDQSILEDAAKAAHIHDFIVGLPRGYETTVGERGVRLSGGQRQRLGIARALFYNPGILIMDEATSALDHQTESEVISAITEIREQRTIIMVTHRLNTVKDCDLIYLMERGRMSDHGTYLELIDRNPTLIMPSAIPQANEPAESNRE